MPSPSDIALPRCLLCGMNCPVGAEPGPTGRARTVFPADLGVAQGACVLGVTAGRLLSSEDRVFQARVRGETADCARGLDAVAVRLAAVEPGEVAVLFDLNRPLEGIAAAAALRDEALAGAKFSAFIPPQDAAVAAAGVGGCHPYSEIAGCDLVLAVGDPCSTHPAVAMALRDMQRAARGNRLICLDTAPGRTSRAADRALFVPPDALAAFLCAVAVECGSEVVREALGGLDAGEIAGRAGLDAAAVGEVAGAVRDAKVPGIVLSNSPGRCGSAQAVLAAAHELARVRGGKLWPLILCSGSAALPALAGRLGLERMGDVLGALDRGEVKVLVVVGWDPAAVLPRRFWGGWRERCEEIVWAGSLESEFAESADVILPLALAWEESGRRVGPQGEVQEIRQWLPAPAGVLTCEEMVRRLGEKLGGSLRPADLGDLCAPPAAQLDVGEWIKQDILNVRRPVGHEAMLVGAPQPQGYGGGLSVGCVSWQQRMSSQERLVVSLALAGALGCEAASGPVLVEAVRDGAQSLAAPCLVARRAGGEPALEGNVLAAPCHWEGLRELLEWECSAGWSCVAEPCTVRVQVVERSARTGEASVACR